MRFPPWSRRWVPWKNLDYVPRLYSGTVTWRKLFAIGSRYCVIIVRGDLDA